VQFIRRAGRWPSAPLA
jgi:hypothetical protein